jgi:hypothetical protein
MVRPVTNEVPNDGLTPQARARYLLQDCHINPGPPAMRRRTLRGTAASTALAPRLVRAQAAGLKVAFVATASGLGAVLGNQMRDGWLLE